MTTGAGSWYLRMPRAAVHFIICCSVIHTVRCTQVVNFGILSDNSLQAQSLRGLVTNAIEFTNNQTGILHNTTINVNVTTLHSDTWFRMILEECALSIWHDVVVLIGDCKSRDIMGSVITHHPLLITLCTNKGLYHDLYSHVQPYKSGRNITLTKDAFIAIIKDILKAEKWERFLFFQDEEYEWLADKVFEVTSDMGIDLVYARVDNTTSGQDIASIFSRTKNWIGQNNYIVACGETVTARLLQQAKTLDILGPDFNWIVTYEGRMDTISELLKHGDDVALIMMVDNVTTLLRKEIQQALLLTSYYYSIMSENVSRSAYSVCGSPAGHGYPTQSHMAVDVLTMDPSMQYFCLNCTKAVVRKCYLCDDEHPLATVATWDNENGLTRLSPIFPKLFPGFQGRMLKVVTIDYPPFTTRAFLENGTVIYGGLCMEILRALADKLDFRYEVVHSVDSKFGIEENGRWNGIVGMVHRKEVDLAAAGLTISKARDAVIDYTVPYWEEPSAVLLKRPDDRYRFLFIFKPFHPYVWLCIAASIVISFISLWLFTKYSAFYDRDSKNTHKYALLRKYHHCAWYTLGAYLQQGGVHMPEASSGRLVVAFFWLFSIVSFATYTGNLIAFLTVSKEDVGMHTLDDLASQNELKFGTQDGIVQHMLFKTSDRGVYKRMWDKMKDDPTALVKSNQEGFTRVKTGTYGYIGEKTNFEAETANDCNFTFLDEEFYKTNFGFALPEGSPYTIHFSMALTSLLEGGLVERWKQMHWPRNERCNSLNIGAAAKVVTVKDAQGLLYLLAGGLTISGLAFFAEHGFRWAVLRYEKYKESRKLEDGPLYIGSQSFMRT